MLDLAIQPVLTALKCGASCCCPGFCVLAALPKPCLCSLYRWLHKNTDGSLIPGHLLTVKESSIYYSSIKHAGRQMRTLSLILIFPVVCAWKKKLNVKSWFRNMHKTEFFQSSIFIRSWKKQWMIAEPLYVHIYSKMHNYPTVTCFPWINSHLF